MTYLEYPVGPHTRRHGPSGYVNYRSYKPWLRDEFSFRCVYCLVRERWYYYGSDNFGVDHIIAKSTDDSLETDYNNLVYACSRCNSAKSIHRIVDPCVKSMADILRIEPDGTVRSLSTPDGDLAIDILNLNDAEAVEFRHQIMRSIKNCEHADDEESLDFMLGYPTNMPNLVAMRCQNSKPSAAAGCFYLRKARGQLPARY
jgi:hypothetical protein